jgi:Arc/MetJ-type ribon-helix-helix transcriptional regulator
MCASEVVRAGLRHLQERDAIVTQWLRDEVVAAYDAMQADSSRGISAEKVLENLQTCHARRTKRALKGPEERYFVNRRISPNTTEP